MLNSLLDSVYLLLMAGFVMSLTGIALAYFNTHMARNFGHIMLAVSAGAIAAIVVFHLIPDAIVHQNTGWTLSGLVLSLLAGRMMSMGPDPQGWQAFLALLLLGLHSMADGVMYEIAVSSRGAEDGMISMIGLALHELPEGVAAFFLLHAAGVDRLRAAWTAVFIVGLSTPAGAFLSAPLMEVYSRSQLDAMFGFIAGLLIAVVIRLIRVVALTMPTLTGVPSLAVGLAVTIPFLLNHHHHHH